LVLARRNSRWPKRTRHLVRSAEMTQALDFVIKNDYPARGEYVGDV
jgi:hypothetical protein